MSWSTYPRETTEVIDVVVTVNGSQVTTGVQFSVVPNLERPGNWVEAVVDGSQIGVEISDLSPGAYRVWALVSGEVVVDCGTFQVS